MSEVEQEQFSYFIQIESEDEDEILKLIHSIDVNKFEVRPYLEEKKGKFTFANIVSDSDWDNFAEIINEKPSISFRSGFESKKSNVRKERNTEKIKNVSVNETKSKSANLLPEMLNKQLPSKYLNLEDSYSILSNIASVYPKYVRSLNKDFPQKTIEGRPFQTLHISTNFSKNNSCLMLVGGLHAREWVPQDALVYFISDLLQALDQNIDLEYGGFLIKNKTIENILSKVDLVVLPCANPDGRVYSQSEWSFQRKNMNNNETGKIIKPGKETDQVGIDLNRNFNIGWDFKDLYQINNSSISASYKPEDSSYHGCCAASEIETKYIVSLLEKFKTTKWLLDCHSYTNHILLPWGLEENQFNDPKMNIKAKKYDKKRGSKNTKAYGEYIHPDHHVYLKKMAESIKESTKKVNDQTLIIREASGFFDAYYPGVLPDYAYSRHLYENDESGNKKPTIFPLTLETGKVTDGFHPDINRAHILKKEICAGIFGLLQMVSSVED